MKRPLRIVYAAGPGDVIRTYSHWKQGQDDPTQLSMTYSGMFYELCRQNGDDAYVISSCSRKDKVLDEHFHIVDRATPFNRGPGPLFYVGRTYAALRLIASALWFRADVVVAACGEVSWITMRLLPTLGIPIVPSLHCVLWPPYRPLTPLQRLLRQLRIPFFTRSAFCILSASEEITHQLAQITDLKHKPVRQFLPSYRRQQFEGIAPPDANRTSDFRVLFAGRIEGNKGVFHLLNIARRFADAGGEPAISFDLCGDGAALPELRQQVAAAGLSDRFRLHGHCDRPTMRRHFESSHVVIVPTTGDFVEGFNQVVAEAILAGRPVITSDVCPAINYVRDAVVQVPVDDERAYGDAILKLKQDDAFYEARRSACSVAAEQFYDMDRSWMAALQGALDQIRLTRGNEAAEISSLAAH